MNVVERRCGNVSNLILISVNDFLSFMPLYIGSDEAATKDKVRLILQTLKHKKYHSDCLYISAWLVHSYVTTLEVLLGVFHVSWILTFNFFLLQKDK